jgi:uncharacterized repeat protein (TIGR03806 family)
MQLTKSLSGLLAASVAWALFAGCGDDEQRSTPLQTPPGDGGTDAAPDVTDAPPPVDSEFGLDTRPPNPGCVAPARPPTTAPVHLERVFETVAFQNALMAMAQVPGDGSRWFAALRNGLVVTFPAEGASGAPTIVADIPVLAALPIQTGGEGGLLGFAFHPDFGNNGHLFVTWTTRGGPTDMRSTVGRVTSTDGGKSFGNYTPVIAPFDQPAQNHNGGGIAFGPDGYLYLSFGDGGSANDAFSKGQRLDEMFSKILRIDVDTTPGQGQSYVIPSDNPFASGGGEPSTFAFGFRNPFRFSFDRETGDLWVGDVGQNAWEEIDLVLSGGNYGWPCREGSHEFTTDPVKCPSTVGLIDPVYEYPHTGGGSVTGGVVYRGEALEGFAGTYVFGDYVTKEVVGLTFDPTDGAPRVFRINESGPDASWVGFAQDQEGEVYALSVFPAEVYKLVSSGEPEAGTFPQKLSETGCVDPSNPSRPAAGLIPFDVNAGLWSDGAEKERWLAIPDGTTIAVQPDGDFDFPAGSVLVKTFWIGGKRIETRLFVRHEDGDWAGYTYEWREDQTDAELLPSGKTKTVGGQAWQFPSRSQCVQCHTAAAGRSLGPEVGQLNKEMVYPSTNRRANQLRTLDHVGLFGAPLGAPVEALDAYPDPFGGDAVERRARAYLHSNCAGCHRPDGPGRGSMDLRYATTLADMEVCGVDPGMGDLGVQGAKLVSPGEPGKSLVPLRMRAMGVHRMPPLSSALVDDEGAKLVEAWIEGLNSCP